MAKKNTKQIEGESTSAPVQGTVKKTSKNSKKWHQSRFMSAIIGIGKLFAVCSIVYSTSVIVLGTEGVMPLIMLIPQALLAVLMLGKQFIKN